jgi:hypothetical protein
VAAALNRPRHGLGVRATPGKACAARTQACPGSDSSPSRGRMRGGGGQAGPAISGCGAGERAVGWWRWCAGWAKPLCWAVTQVSQDKEMVAHRQNSGCWAANENGPKARKAEGNKRKGFGFLEKSTSK